MHVLNIVYENHQFVLDLSPWNGAEQLLVNGQVVSKKQNHGLESVHEVEIENLGRIRLLFNLQLSSRKIQYQFYVNDQLIEENISPLVSLNVEVNREEASVKSSVESTPARTHSTQSGASSKWTLLPLLFKLVKSIQVVKVALLAASVGAYSIIFSLEFAIALIAVLVFHEYGHLRAMKKFGIPTKGMYLIPFVGGMAVGDSPRTRWEDVYISMMGPVYGLIMTVMFYIFYLITGNHFAGLVTSVSALLNLFNLIPVHPLDGGRVIKAIVFSGRNRLAFVGLLFISSVCLVVAWKAQLVFLVFFIVIGALDIISSWRVSLTEDITPLKPYGIVYSLIWYLITAAIFIALILLIAADSLPGSEIATRVLQS